jgi:hypothetical protein
MFVYLTDYNFEMKENCNYKQKNALLIELVELLISVVAPLLMLPANIVFRLTFGRNTSRGRSRTR